MADITLAADRVPAPPSSTADITKDLTWPVPGASAPNPVCPPLSQAARRQLRLTANDPRMHEEVKWPTRTPMDVDMLSGFPPPLPFRKACSLDFDHEVELDLGINGQVINRAKFANGSLDNCVLSPPIPYRPKYVSAPGGDIVPLPARHLGLIGRSKSVPFDVRLCVPNAMCSG